MIPSGTPIKIIKVDVEGAELGLLEGATKILRKYKPLIIFETGMGGSDVYGTTPEKLFAYLKDHDYGINLLDRFLKNKSTLTEKEFCDQFYEGKNYYFVAS